MDRGVLLLQNCRRVYLARSAIRQQYHHQNHQTQYRHLFSYQHQLRQCREYQQHCRHIRLQDRQGLERLKKEEGLGTGSLVGCVRAGVGLSQVGSRTVVSVATTATSTGTSTTSAAGGLYTSARARTTSGLGQVLPQRTVSAGMTTETPSTASNPSNPSTAPNGSTPLNMQHQAKPATEATEMPTTRKVDEWNAMLDQGLEENDPEVFAVVRDEMERQRECLELIASENLTSKAVMQALGTPLTNKYSEGYPGARYYGGNEHIDTLERLCQVRALKAFGLDPDEGGEWAVNVQPYSGSPANFAVYTAFLNPHDRIMGLDLPSGGHLTHGFMTAKKRVSATSVYFESMPYQVGNDGWVDYDGLEQRAKVFRPRMIVCGASAYSRDWEYERLRKIADGCGAYLFADIAHVSGLISSGHLKSPFKHCHVVTTTTHKTLRGPRAAMIFIKKDTTLAKDPSLDVVRAVNEAVFPGLQGGPHNHQIAAMAVALKQALHPSFRTYTTHVIQNARTLTAALLSKGYHIATSGTDNHVLLWNLRPLTLTGSKLSTLCDRLNMTLNKNCVPGDTSALSPSGVRIGTAALTSRSTREADWLQVAEFLHEAVQLAVKVQGRCKGSKLKEFVEALDGVEEEIQALKHKVRAFALSLPMPGF